MSHFHRFLVALLRSWQKPQVIGYALIIFTFGIMGGWAAVAPLDRALVSPGVVMIENSRKVVQHLEGGLVREILVEEGQKVASGDVLFRLSPVQARSKLDSLGNERDGARVLEARLVAELNHQADIAIPDDLLKRSVASAFLSRLIADQTTQFQDRKNSIATQIRLIESKTSQLQTEIDGIAIEKTSNEKQTALIDEELTGLHSLKKKGLIPVTRVLTSERERARLEGLIGRAVADTAKASDGIAEAQIQITQLKQKFLEDVSAQLLDVRQKISDMSQDIVVAQDTLDRLEIKAPRSGTVQSLKVFTIGQVIRPGEDLMEIVPTQETFVIHVRLPVDDIEHLTVGQPAEIKFPAFHSRRLPLLMGTLANVSRDRLVDENTRQPYFLGIISLANANMPQSYRTKLVAGMQAEVVIATGERTAWDYIISPLTDAMHKAFTD